LRSAAEDEDLGERERVRVRDGQQRRSAADGFESPRGPAVQPQLRRAAPAHDFDVSPQHALRMTSAKGLHGGFFRGEPSREMDGRFPPPHTVGHLTLGEDTMGEAFAISFDSLDDPRDIRRVDP